MKTMRLRNNVKNKIALTLNNQSTILDKSVGTLAFLGRFPIHTGQTPPLTQKQCWTRVSRIFSEFQLCIGWGEGELQENFEKDALF